MVVEFCLPCGTRLRSCWLLITLLSLSPSAPHPLVLSAASHLSANCLSRCPSSAATLALQPSGAQPQSCRSHSSASFRVLSLRGGSDFEKVALNLDPQLRKELWIDYQRQQQGKVPMFLERLDSGNYETTDFRYNAGVEARMPATMGGDNHEMQDTFPKAAEPREDAPTDTRAKHELDLERAKAYFKEIDEKYFPDDELTQEVYPRHKVFWQKREPNPDAHPLENYLEARRLAQSLQEYFKSLPSDLKPGSPEMIEYLKEQGHFDIIDRNGTRHVWDENFKVDPTKEWDDPYAAWPQAHDFNWFRNTSLQLLNEAWELPEGTDFGQHFCKKNSTFADLAASYTMIPDRELMNLQDEHEELVGKDPHKDGGYKAFWNHVGQKWDEIQADALYNDEGMEAIEEAEAELEARYGESKAFRTYSVHRKYENQGVDSSEDP